MLKSLLLIPVNMGKMVVTEIMIMVFLGTYACAVSVPLPWKWLFFILKVLTAILYTISKSSADWMNLKFLRSAARICFIAERLEFANSLLATEVTRSSRSS